MKLKFTFLKLIVCLMISNASFSQAIGDYRSNVSPTGVWSAAANWQTWDGASWITASSAPTSADGVITILAGDSMRIESSVTIDQVVVQATGKLAIFVNAGTVTCTINNGTGTDLEVNGNLHYALGATITGTGNVVVNSGGLFGFRRGAIMNVPTTVNGTAILGASGVAVGTIDNTTLTLNGNSDWVNGDINLVNGGNFTNSGAMTSSASSLNRVLNGAGSNSFNLTGTGSLIKTNSTAATQIDAPLNIAANATIGGIGTFTYPTASVVSNAGAISPGTSPGVLTVAPAYLTAQPTEVVIEIVSSTTPGTGHDQLAVSGSASLTSASLTVTDNVAAPLGVYTIMTSTGTFTGPFASTNIPANYGNLTISGGTVTIEKLSTLPVSWVSFTAIAQNNSVLLNWKTDAEVNASHFIVEHATEGGNYKAVGTIQASGNTNTLSSYNFTHTAPGTNANNLYRIKQVDFDGSFDYSEVRNVRFTNGNVKVVTAGPNPFVSQLNISVQEKNIAVTITNLNGVELRRWKFQPGTYQVQLGNLPKGMYQLNVFQENVRVEGQRLIKL
ncbi:MAG: T9SS type A sorting domain-containing protein [Chitinophagaceae bacterium]